VHEDTYSLEIGEAATPNIPGEYNSMNERNATTAVTDWLTVNIK
jgi:hypothetical protein